MPNYIDITDHIDVLKEEESDMMVNNRPFGDPPERTIEVESRLEEIREEIESLEDEIQCL